MTREEFDNRVNEAVLAMDALEDRCRLKGINEANIEHITESIQERLQKEVVRFNMHEADMRINEAVLALDELEDGCRRSGMDEATISYMTRAVKDMIDENAVRVEKRYGPVREEFSDTVFAGAGSAGLFCGHHKKCIQRKNGEKGYNQGPCRRPRRKRQRLHKPGH